MNYRSPLLNVMTGAALKAAKGLIRDFGELEQLQVSKKGPADFVSRADHKSESVLRSELKKARPAYGLLMEESGERAGTDTSNRWVIDPLDGTTNFLHGIPHFSISIGLERDGEPYAGVIYSPIADEMFVAERGGGAFLNGRRLRVSGRRNVEEALFATGIPFLGLGDHGLFLKQLGAVMAVCTGVRRYGSAALDLAWVAAGRFDGFWENGLHPWDITAGIVLVREAGGFVSDLSGGRKMFSGGGVLASNAALHEPLVALVGSAARAPATAP
ncbi:MAG: inositol monophosphatase [Rhodospirillales bacterium]|nr:inositol monophosphatase [Rhodospirillales bacterium]